LKRSIENIPVKSPPPPGLKGTIAIYTTAKQIIHLLEEPTDEREGWLEKRDLSMYI
jgi:hypothetical protein